MIEKQDHDATTDGMPEAPVTPSTPVPPTLGALWVRVHEMEEAFHGFVSHEGHQHPAVLAWLDKMKARYVMVQDSIKAELDRLSAKPDLPPTGVAHKPDFFGGVLNRGKREG